MANDFINCAPKAVPHQAAKSGELAIATEDCRWSYEVPRELSVLASKKSRWPRADSQARGECWLQNPAPATWSTEARVRELSRRPEHFISNSDCSTHGPKGSKSSAPPKFHSRRTGFVSGPEPFDRTLPPLAQKFVAQGTVTANRD